MKIKLGKISNALGHGYWCNHKSGECKAAIGHHGQKYMAHTHSYYIFEVECDGFVVKIPLCVKHGDEFMKKFDNYKEVLKKNGYAV